MAVIDPALLRANVPSVRAERTKRVAGWFGGPAGLVGVGLLSALVVLALVGPLLTGYSVVAINPLSVMHSPSAAHLFGTDDLGRDVFTRVMYGLRTSLAVAAGSVGVAMVIGLPIGLTAGYVSGHVDLILMRGIDLLLSFPALLLAIVLLTILGAGEGVTILAIGVIFVPIIARVTRSAVVVVRGMPYISGARARGASHVRVLVGHVIPNSLAPVIVQASVLTGFAILIEASLAFLGLGVQPPTPDLGAILNEGGNFATQAPWIEVAAGAALALTILAFNLTGRGLQRGLDEQGGLSR